MKRLIIIILSLLFSWIASAQTQDQLGGQCSPSELTELPAIDWWSAVDDQIEKAFCLGTSFSITDIGDYLEEQSNNSSKSSDNFLGIDLQDESPELIQALKKLTVIPPDASQFIYTQYREEQIPYNIPADCHKAVCAAEAIFGSGNGKRMLYLMDRYGLNTSHKIYRDADAWGGYDLNNIVQAMNAFPSFMMPLKDNQKFIRFTMGVTPYYADERTVANASMEFFDPFVFESNAQKRYTIFHEFGHKLGSELKLDERQDWLDISGWEEKEEGWSATKPEKCVSKYGKTNPAEDFAESVAAYRYNPQLLKIISPEKYTFIKDNIFLGMEYTSEAACQEENSYYHTKVLPLLQKEFPYSENLFSYKNCKKQFMKSFVGEANQFTTCIQNIMQQEKYQKTLQESGLTKLSQEAIKRFHWKEKPEETPEKVAEVTRKLQKQFADEMAKGFDDLCQSHLRLFNPEDPQEEICTRFKTSCGIRLYRPLDDAFKEFNVIESMQEDAETLFYETCQELQLKGKSPCPKIERVSLHFQKRIPTLKAEAEQTLRAFPSYPPPPTTAPANGGKKKKRKN